MPDGVDPDEYLIGNGFDKFIELVNASSMTAEGFLVSQLEKVYSVKTPNSKVKSQADIIPYLEKIKNAVMRSEWIKYVSERLIITKKR